MSGALSLYEGRAKTHLPSNYFGNKSEFGCMWGNPASRPPRLEYKRASRNMRNRNIVAVAFLAWGLSWASARAIDPSQSPGSGQAQSSDSSGDSSQQTPTSKTPAPSTPAKDKSKSAGSPSADQSAAPDAPQAAAPKKPSTGEDNPFPEDISRKAAAEVKGDTAAPDAPAPADSAPDAKQSQGSSSLDGVDKLGLDDEERQKLKLASPDGSPDVYDPKRATEDVRVGKFYLKTGDYKGAYDRFKDATLYDHEDADAVFWLAEAARKIDHRPEAVQNYRLYLAAVPDGPNSKAARKALGELSASSSLSLQHP